MRREGPSYTVDTIQYFKNYMVLLLNFTLLQGLILFVHYITDLMSIDELIDEVHLLELLGQMDQCY